MDQSIDKKNFKTLVFGASQNTERSSNQAIRQLRAQDYPVVAIGGREGEVEDVTIQEGHPELKDIHTVTMYMGAPRQEDHIEYLIGLHPTRIILNPGAENQELYYLATKSGIKVIEACTLVLLSTDQYEVAGIDTLP